MLNNPLSGPLAPLGIAADELYTWGAGLYLLGLGLHARASSWTLLRMFAYLLTDSLVGLIPWAGGLIDFLFQGHMFGRPRPPEGNRKHPLDRAGLNHSRAEWDSGPRRHARQGPAPDGVSRLGRLAGLGVASRSFSLVSRSMAASAMTVPGG